MYRLRHTTVIDAFAVSQVKELSQNCSLQEKLGEIVQSLEPYDQLSQLVGQRWKASESIIRCNSKRLAAFAIGIIPRRLSLLRAGLVRLICSL